MVGEADYYKEAATRLHERERSIKAARGRILDRNEWYWRITRRSVPYR